MRLDTVYLDVGSAETVAACRDFYTTVLGLRLTSEEPNESVWVDAGGGTSIGFHTGSPPGNPAAVNICLRVDDVDAAAAAIESRGATLAQHPRDAHWGDRVASLHDPAGHAVWLLGPLRG